MANDKDSSPSNPPLALPPSLVSCDGSQQVQHEEPSSSSSNYMILSDLGEGTFGKVIRSLKEDTNEIVALKILKQNNLAGKEVSMLKELRCLDPDNCNIVKFYDNFLLHGQTCLVFEILDISLFDYLEQRRFNALQLTELRSTIQQMATAFEALKSIGVIHADVKPDNILLVDHLKEPFRVKLIDFGCAILRSEAKPGSTLQTDYYRSPEIILGLPFSEAIDMWSLGCVVSDLFLCCHLFPGQRDYDLMRFIVDILGQPADHLLNAGLKTNNSFHFSCDGWRLKTPGEYARQTGYLSEETRRYKFRSLDHLTELNLEKEDRSEVDERREFVDLLKQMLQMDASQRITPSEVLAHPFVTMSHLSNDSHHSSQNSEHTSSQPVRTMAKLETDESSNSARGTSTKGEPRIILVQSYLDMATNQSDGAPEQDSHQTSPQAVLDKVSSSQESLSERPLATITEGTPSLNTTEVGAPTASPAVDSATVAITLVPLSSPVAGPAIAVNQAALSHDNLVNTDSAHSTSEVSKPKKKKKKGVRRFFSRLRALFCCGAAQDAPVE